MLARAKGWDGKVSWTMPKLRGVMTKGGTRFVHSRKVDLCTQQGQFNAGERGGRQGGKGGPGSPRFSQIKVCVSISWRCLGTSVRVAPHLTVSLCSAGLKVEGP